MSAADPLVSIITPVYNSVAFLPQAREGIRQQSFSDWEWILVDDYSSDSSYELIQMYAKEDSRVIALRMQKNSGPALARNAAISMARGRYIAFCDSDDVWTRAKLERQLQAIKKSGAAICFSSYIKIREDGTSTGSIVDAQPLVTYSMILKSNLIGCSTAIYDQNRCGKVLMPDLGRVPEDYGLWLKILGPGHIAIGLKEALVQYRVRPGSDSRNKLRAATHHWNALRKIAKLSPLRAGILFCHYAWRGIRKSAI